MIFHKMFGVNWKYFYNDFLSVGLAFPYCGPKFRMVPDFCVAFIKIFDSQPKIHIWLRGGFVCAKYAR